MFEHIYKASIYRNAKGFAFLVTSLTDSNHSSTSQAVVEKKLEKPVQEFQTKKREESIFSTQSTESISADEKLVWRAIRKKLKDIGITVATFDANKDFIFEWFSKAVESGAFLEQV